MIVLIIDESKDGTGWQNVGRLLPTDGKGIEELSQRASVSPLIAKILLARGVVDPTHIASFLEAKLDQLRDPESLPGLTQVADRLYDAVQQKRISSFTAIMMRTV
jgi:single-stranded-DNA-specific exonuclease